VSSLNDPAPKDVFLSRFLSVRDNYSGHIAHFVRYLKSNRLRLDLSAVRAYFKYLNALPLAASTKCVRRQAVKARLRATLTRTDFNRQAMLEMTLRSLDHDSETKAPGFVMAGVSEDRIVTPEQFDLLVRGTLSEPRYSRGFFATPAAVRQRCATPGWTSVKTLGTW
jgi:hypothetical protein